MAVVQYTGIVNQVRGKLNGSVFNKSRNANTLQRKQQSPQGSRGFQSEIRNVFSNIQRLWKDATPAEKNDWQLAAENNPSTDRFGNPTVLSGYNQYMKANIFRFYGLNTFYPDVSPEPALAYDITDLSINLLDFTVDGTGRVQVEYDITWSSTNIDTDHFVILDISLPISRGVTNYYQRYTFIASNGSTFAYDVAGTVDLGTKYPIPRSQQRVIVRARAVYIANGAVVQTAFTEIIYS